MRLRKISLSGGKYEVIASPPDVPCDVLRHGKHWRNVLGDGFVASLVAELASLREVLRCAEDAVGSDDRAAQRALQVEIARHREWGHDDPPASWEY